jgi:hypothetical protein
LGYAGHNLYRFHWQWFAAFQAIAVGCLRLRAAAHSYEASLNIPLGRAGYVTGY